MNLFLLIKSIAHKKINRNYFLFFLICLITGFSEAWFFRIELTPLLFKGKLFEARTILVQIGLLLLFTSMITAVLTGIIGGLRALFDSRIIKNADFSIRISLQERYVFILLAITVIATVIISINNVVSMIDTVNWVFDPPNTLKWMRQVGNDFRVGIFIPGKTLLYDINIYHYNDGIASLTQYPPFLNILFLPFQLLNENSAYLVHVFLLFLSNFTSLLIVSLFVKEIILSRTNLELSAVWAITILIFFGMLICLFSSYGFAFSIERGNCDAIALLFSVLSLFALYKKPETVWLQVLLLSIAVHIKIYPAALFLILFMRHGKRMLLPSLLVNIIMLFILGPKNAVAFVQTIIFSSGVPYVWIGNHSGYSFAEMLVLEYPILEQVLAALRFNFTLIPILVWIGTIYVVYTKRKENAASLLAFIATIPIMSLVPTISHDYKLVILYPAAVVFLGLIVYQIIRQSGVFDYLQLFLFGAILFFLGRSYVLNSPSYSYSVSDPMFYINNKYLWVLFFQVIIFEYIYRFTQPGKSATDTVVESGSILVEKVLDR